MSKYPVGTCPTCGANMTVYASIEAPWTKHGWTMLQAEISEEGCWPPEIPVVCTNGHEFDTSDLPVEPLPGKVGGVRAVQELVARAYNEALEDGNDMVTGPLAEAMVWLDGKLPED